MSIKPILFNTDMVRAILDGRKTVTRRVIKPQPKSRLCYTFAGSDHGTWGYPGNAAHEYLGEEYRLSECITVDDKRMIWKPPYHADDILYIRETWCWFPCWDCGFDTNEHNCCHKSANKFFNHNKREYGCYGYKASFDDNEYPSVDTWHPSIHMPKEAARIWMKVKDVRVERLQCMSWDDICNEGIISDTNVRDDFSFRMLQNKFRNLWNSTIKKSDLDRYGWDANPWVWVIEFERCEKPEEE